MNFYEQYFKTEKEALTFANGLCKVQYTAYPPQKMNDGTWQVTYRVWSLD